MGPCGLPPPVDPLNAFLYRRRDQFDINYLFLYHLGGMKHAKSKHNIHMKIIDDQLRIIDDVPSSAVELSVKEKVIKNINP